MISTLRPAVMMNLHPEVGADDSEDSQDSVLQAVIPARPTVMRGQTVVLIMVGLEQ